MKVVLATAFDLFQFAIGQSPETASSHVTPTLATVPKEAPPTTAEPVVSEYAPVTGTTSVSGVQNTVMYVASTEAYLYANPQYEFDGVKLTLHYGTLVVVLTRKSDWTQVMVNEEIGWVQSVDLSDQAGDIFPVFTLGEANQADDPNTIRARAVIQDEFGGGAMSVPLKAVEYVAYRLAKKGKQLSWPDTRPREAGAWHKILKGATGVHIGIEPRSDAVMEYTLETGRSHVAYVEAVLSDHTITISETDWPYDGIYNARVLTKDEWQGLKPVFISVA